MAANENEMLDPRAEQLLERAGFYLENGRFDEAHICCERVLQLDEKNAAGYLYMLCSELGCKTKEELKNGNELFDNHESYQMAFFYGDSEQKAFLRDCLLSIIDNKKQEVYNEALSKMELGSMTSLREAAEVFGTLQNFKGADEKQKECLSLAEEKRKEYVYNQALFMKQSGEKSLDVRDFQKARDDLLSIADYKDAAEQAEYCNACIEMAKREQVNERKKENERIFFLRKKAEEDNRQYFLRLLKTTWIYLAIIAATITVVALISLQTKM